jgi:HPt (histidine-containing phosphotransfer) domain-containing protein
MVSELREMCESCPEVARELVDTFREDSIPLLREVREAIAASDASRLRQAAHGVKGAAANLGGNSLAALCHELEIKGRAGTVDGAEALCPRVEAEFERFCAALDALVRGAE